MLKAEKKNLMPPRDKQKSNQNNSILEPKVLIVYSYLDRRQSPLHI